MLRVIAKCSNVEFADMD